MRQPLSKMLCRPYSWFCIGSLPFADQSQAVNFVLDRPWIVPFWPELPIRSKSELMLARTERVLDPDWSGHTPDEASGMFELKRALAAGKYRLPLLKCQIMGPLSFVFFSRFLEGPFAAKLQLAVDACLRQLEWQRHFLKELNLPLLFVLDEPGLIHWQELAAEDAEMIRDAYSYLYVHVSEAGGWLGLHSCAAFFPAMLEFPFELVSFDISGEAGQEYSGPKWRGKWEQALDRGLLPVPGVFPAIGGSDPASLRIRGEMRFREFAEFLARIGRPHPELLVSASCGHAFADPGWLDCLYDRAIEL